MGIEERLRKRALELIEQGGQLTVEGRSGAENHAPFHEGRLQEWMTSSLALVELIVALSRILLNAGWMTAPLW